MKKIEVVAAIIIRDNKIFATQRGYGEYEGWWEFPGGKMEIGETQKVALLREIREELDIDIEVGDFFKTIKYSYPNFELTMHCYLCSLKGAEPKLLEHKDALWIETTKLDTLKWLPADVSLIRDLGEYLS